jgi:hypothetical protein
VRSYVSLQGVPPSSVGRDRTGLAEVIAFRPAEGFAAFPNIHSSFGSGRRGPIQHDGQPRFHLAFRIPVTVVPEVGALRASHIVAWADCPSDSERLDVFNILLVADLDAAFDAALMSFDEQGAPLLSSKLSQEAQAMLAAKLGDVSIRLTPRHQAHLDEHRARFRALDSAT